MSKNLTWLKPSGEWGIEGVDLTALPPAAYGALAKLMRLEHPFRGPNPPLTLEELREMDGEPVWIEFTKCAEANGWMLVAVNRHCVYDGLLGDCDFANCGKTWRAYRRRLEEIQT